MKLRYMPIYILYKILDVFFDFLDDANEEIEKYEEKKQQ